MQLVEGVHHVAFLTEDMDRLVAFYERVFDARKTLDMTADVAPRTHSGARCR
jgi:catechol 2,3-dioxygenase-like lactoylglutathione lyase family enzyme